MTEIKSGTKIASLFVVLALSILCASAGHSNELGQSQARVVATSENIAPQTFCLQSTKSILNSDRWTAKDKAEVQNWLLQVQNLIVNSVGFKQLQEDNLPDFKVRKAVYAFCIDSSGMPVGFHVLSRETFTPLDEKISAIVESAGPYPKAPNQLPWLQGGMRVELTLAREFKLSILPDWPNRRLAAL